jgi:exopolysaccharide production protein ExoY
MDPIFTGARPGRRFSLNFPGFDKMLSFDRYIMTFVPKSISSSTPDALAVSTDAAPRGMDYTRSSGTAPGRPPIYRASGKRAIDVFIVLLAAPFWMPMVLLGALFVALDGHNPFYSQERIGRDGRVFRMWKLRSMVPDADARLESHLADDPEARAEWDATQKLKNDPRITVVGRVLRKTSLDELPQLFNVLSGDMSLVGPRPIMVCQQTLYPGRRYYDMRPGLTGLWQVSERNECSFIERVHFDDAYHRMMSFWTDMTILARTFSVVLRGTGY